MQADASSLLGLVRQLRKLVISDSSFIVDEADAMFESLHDRIAALVPQESVQARDMYGAAFWWHPCGFATSDQNHHEQVCRHPGPWRPLLVAPDAAPDGNRFGMSGWIHSDGTSCPEYLAPAAPSGQWWCTTHEMSVHQP